VPLFSRSGRRGIRVVEREYIGDVVSSSTPGNFSLSKFPIQPGSALTFPWLSTIAEAFEEYKIHGLVFEFVSTSASYGGGASQALGVVAMATDYDVLDPVFLTLQDMQNEEGAVSARASEVIHHGVEWDAEERPRKVYFVRTGALPAQSTLMDYDFGNFEVATAGCPTASTNLGQLHVSYDIEFFKKTAQSSAYGNQLQAVQLTSLTPSTISDLLPLGTSHVTQGNLQTSFGSSSFTVTAQAQGQFYIVEGYWVGTGGAAIVNPTLTYTNAAITSQNWDSHALPGYGVVDNTNHKCMFRHVVQATSTSWGASLSGSTLPTGCTTGEINITQI
jgi:hypothetical protein